MKLIATTFVLLFAGTYSLPQDQVGLDGVEARITVTNRIQKAVNDMNQNLVALGYDPLLVADKSFDVRTPIGWGDAHVEGLLCSGIANNRFTQLSFNTITMRLNFVLVWPRMACELKSLGVAAALLGREFVASNTGSVELINTSVGGTMRVRARPISGVSIIDCQLELDTKMQSNLEVKWQGRDVSDKIKERVEAINDIIQASKQEVGRKICELLEQVM